MLKKAKALHDKLIGKAGMPKVCSAYDCIYIVVFICLCVQEESWDRPWKPRPAKKTWTQSWEQPDSKKHIKAAFRRMPIKSEHRWAAAIVFKAEGKVQ